MPSSVPIPFQAILWPLAGAVLIFALGRLLPNWLRRLLAVMAALIPLVILWPLGSEAVESVEIFWEPLNFFRMSPGLHSDSLSLLTGITLAGVTAAVVLGIRGYEPQRTAWHGLILVALAGCLTTAMAANLLTLALGSALIDLALIATALLVGSDTQHHNGMSLSVTVPGLMSTLILFFGALQMDAQVGHASLLARNLPEGILIMVGVAGVLRCLLFPLHPRGLATPESAVTLLLPVGMGIYLLTRVQAIAPVLSDQQWMLAAGNITLLVGGLLVWSGSASAPERKDSGSAFVEFWPGMLVHQTGYALAFALLWAGATPWPLMGLTPALGILAIWWDGSLERQIPPRSRWIEWILQWVRPAWTRGRSYVTARFPGLERWRDRRLIRYGMVVLPVMALASLAGAPLTAGARGRWSLYASLLKSSNTSLLIVLAADIFLAAGLWLAFGIILKQAREYRPRPAPLLSMIVLVALILVLGIAPGSLNPGLALKPPGSPGVSVWGLGLLFALPWLLGSWLARVGTHLRGYFRFVKDILNLNWLYRVAGWVGQRLASAIYWLGQVGEGEGWWGWILIILVLGAVFLTVR